MTEIQRPTLVINPSDDVAFHDEVEASLREGQSAGGLQETLRPSYPRTVVRPRDLAGERPVVWYVYREGHWIAPNHRDEG